MKKITNLSIVTSLLVAGLTSANAYDLKGAFENAKVSGEIKAMYFDETQTTKEDQISAIGGKLSIETGLVEGFYGKATFQTSHIIDYSASADNVFKKDMDASGSVLSESYLGFKMDDISLKAGRQFIKTPLLAGSGSRMIKDSFEGYTAQTKLMDTKIIAGYITKYANRTDTNGSTGKFLKDGLEDGAKTIYLENKTIDSLKVRAQYLTVEDTIDMNTLYLDASYNIKDMGTKISAQYGKSDNGANTDSDGSLFGIKIDQKFSDLTITAAMNQSGKKADYESGLGEGAHYAFTKLSVGSGKKSYNADSDSMMIKLAYKMGDLKVGIAHAEYEDNANDKEYEENEVTLAYKFNKQTYIKASHSTFNGNDDSSDYETRVTLGYKF